LIKLAPTNGFVARTYVKREPIGRMLLWIHRSGIDKWWERNCDAFIWKEEELRRKSVENTHEAIFYSERSSDQYDIFWVKIPRRIFPLDKEATRSSRVPRTSQEDLHVGHRKASNTLEAGLSSHVSN
jgi:hypothetical protein